MLLYYAGNDSARAKADGKSTGVKLVIKVCLKIRAVQIAGMIFQTGSSGIVAKNLKHRIVKRGEILIWKTHS